MGTLIRSLMFLALILVPVASAYAQDQTARSVTIAISVMLMPDPSATRADAVDCAAAVTGGDDNQRVCSHQDRVYYAQRKDGRVMVTVTAI